MILGIIEIFGCPYLSSKYLSSPYPLLIGSSSSYVHAYDIYIVLGSVTVPFPDKLMYFQMLYILSISLDKLDVMQNSLFLKSVEVVEKSKKPNSFGNHVRFKFMAEITLNWLLKHLQGSNEQSPRHVEG